MHFTFVMSIIKTPFEVGLILHILELRKPRTVKLSEATQLVGRRADIQTQRRLTSN